jgi:hypothetical protein
MTQGGNLSCFDVWGKLRGLGGGFRSEGVAGDVGAGGADGGVVAAGEQTGEEASETKGSYFQEAAFGTGSRQERHELGSKAVHG